MLNEVTKETYITVIIDDTKREILKRTWFSRSLVFLSSCYLCFMARACSHLFMFLCQCDCKHGSHWWYFARRSESLALIGWPFSRRLRRKIVSVVLIGGKRRERDALPSCSGAFLRSLAKVTDEMTSLLQLY